MTITLAYAPPPIAPQAEYYSSDIVLIGKVVTSSLFSPAQMKYEIQVEQYLKNPLPQNSVSVIAYGTTKSHVETGLAPSTVFDVGQRIFLYLKNDHGIYTVWWFSHPTDSLCNPAPTKDDLNFESPKGIDNDYEPILILPANDSANLYVLNHPVVISFDAWNSHYTSGKFDVNFVVKNGTDDSMIFNDTKQIDLKPCIGHQTVTTSFVPKTSGTYNIDVNFDKSLQETTFEMPNNHDQRAIPEFPLTSVLLVSSFALAITVYTIKSRLNIRNG